MKKGIRIKSLLSCFGLFLLTYSLSAQQVVQYSQYLFNQLSYNPAYAGAYDGIQLTAALRKQWLGLEGSPFSQNVNAHLPVPYLNSGVGILIENDILGAERNTSLYLSYSYQIFRSQRVKAALGINAGILQKNIDGSQLISPDGIYDVSIDHQDAIISNTGQGNMQPDAGVGVYMEGEKWDLSLSVQQLLGLNYMISGLEGDALIRQDRSFYFSTSYEFKLGYTISLRPSLLLKSNLKSVQSEGGVILKYNDFVEFGVAFRGYKANTFDAVIGMLGVNLSENIRIGYSYDVGISSLRTSHSGSHELVINYLFSNLFNTKGGKVIYNPRFL